MFIVDLASWRIVRWCSQVASVISVTTVMLMMLIGLEKVTFTFVVRLCSVTNAAKCCKILVILVFVLCKEGKNNNDLSD